MWTKQSKKRSLETADKPARNTKRRDKICFAFQKGSCSRGSACSFLHANSSENQKTKEFKSSNFDQDSRNHEYVKVTSQPSYVEICDLNDSGIPDEFRTFFDKGMSTKLQKPTLVQRRCWPAILSGKDVFSIAPTGSGKTLAYILPAIRHVIRLQETEKHNQVAVLVLVPTRELACQVESVCRRLPKLFSIYALAVYGGKEKGTHIEKLRKGANIVIGTPGRTIDLINMKELVLQAVSMLIIDEADKMLDMGFEEDVRKILSAIGEVHQTVLLSATLRKKVEDAILRMGVFRENELVKIVCEQQEANSEETTSGSINKKVEQVVHVCAEHKKPRKLMIFFRKVREQDKQAGRRNASSILVFCNKIKTVNFLHKFLVKEKVKAGYLHGQLSQAQREKFLGEFKAGKLNVLIATDVASRGLHIAGLPYVVNYTFPSSLELYIHRIGRTGRGNEGGYAYSFFTKNFAPLASPLVKLLRNCEQKLDPNLLALCGEANQDN